MYSVSVFWFVRNILFLCIITLFQYEFVEVMTATLHDLTNIAATRFV